MCKLKLRLRSKMIILVLIVLIPLVSLYLIGLKNQFYENIEEELRLNRNYAKTINISFINFLEENWSQQYAIGIAILSNPLWKNEDVSDYISEALSEKRYLKGYSWISPDGTTVASSDINVTGISVLEMEFYKRIIAGETKVVSNLRESITDKSLVLHIARAIYDDSELKGIMLEIVDVKSLSDIFKFKIMDDTARLGLVDSNGMMVYRHNYMDLSLEERKISSDSPLLMALKGECVTFTNNPSQYDTSNRSGVAYPIKEIGWASYYSVSTTEVTNRLWQITRKEIFVLILTSISSLFLAIMLGNRFADSLEELKDAAEEVSKGNLSIKTSLYGNDELAATGEAFNRMAEEINNQINYKDEIVRLKTQFFSIVSHELKTPINIILGAVQLMESIDDINKESMRKYISMQRQNSYRLLRLINNLIDINKIEGNQFSVNKVNCDIVSLVEGITTSVVDFTRMKNIELIFDTEAEEKVMAIDPDNIERIMLNLISNAIKYTDDGGRIEVQLYDKGDTIEISVKDTGVGIPEHMYPSIFQYFTQVDSSLHRRAEGSGIGLSLVKSLVDMNGGTIKVNSAIGIGTEFIIKFPVIVVESDELATTTTSFTNIERINIEFSDIYK